MRKKFALRLKCILFNVKLQSYNFGIKDKINGTSTQGYYSFTVAAITDAKSLKDLHVITHKTKHGEHNHVTHVCRKKGDIHT